RKDPTQFEYPGSLIGPVVAARVSYHKPNRDDIPPVVLEDLWYHDWQALGCRRYQEFTLGNNAQVAIEVKQVLNPSPSQSAAAANAAIRIFLEVFSQRNSVAVLIVPDEQMAEIGSYMRKAGFHMGPEPPPEQPVVCSLVIPIVSKSGAARQMLF